MCLVKMIFEEGDAEAEETEGGRSFADYELHEEIGRGGMGLVYRAWEPGLRRTVALKLLLGGAFASREAIARFKKEAQIAAGLHHPHLVPIYAADEADGQPYYVMELIAGESLAALTGETVGSPAFMAPELAGGGKNLSSPSTDLYAVGAVFYQALTGDRHFRGRVFYKSWIKQRTCCPSRRGSWCRGCRWI